MSRNLLSLLAVVANVVSLPALASDPPTKDGQPDVLAEFNIAKGGRLITVPLKLHEREYLFVLDTGASRSVFDNGLTNLLGKPIGTQATFTFGGPLTTPIFNPPEAFLGELDLRQGGPVISADLESARRAEGRDIRGLLGMGFLKNYVVRVDFDSGKLQFRRWDGRSHPEWGVTVHLVQPTESDVVPFASARLPGAGNVLFRLDSGNGSSASKVTEVFAKAMDQAAIAHGFAATAAGIQPVKSGRLSNFTLGGIDHPDLVVDEEQIFNVMGLGILSRHVVTFDFPGMKMYLQKGQSFARRDESDMSGLRLWRIGDRITVHSVDDGSPASTAGLKPEDVVLRIGNLSAAAVVLDDLRDLLKSGDGKVIQMTIKRGEAEKAVSFKLKKRI